MEDFVVIHQSLFLFVFMFLVLLEELGVHRVPRCAAGHCTQAQTREDHV